ncbi:tetratricopeptide repeat-containing sensor histidine kinase [Flavobacterium reichenbachii]|uniref:tetratricopeptide repeat-containing sensor histidine kinase n=1 Tax=Flavobacterium reichenbachii TaxID=362418 RepID=UPI001F0B523E|nr:ATP-binding protein [Flavobacterium reichenbachii]
MFFVEKNWDSTLVYSGKQLNNAPNNELREYSLYFRGVSFKNKKLFKEAEKELNKISSDFEFYYKVRIKLGEIAVEQKQYNKALQYFQGILKETDKAVYDLKKSVILHNIGLCYLHLTKFDKAEEYLFRSADLQKAEKDTLLLIGSYMDIATLYYEQYKDQLAIPYFEKAYNLSKNVKSFELKQNSTMNMAVIEENRKNFAAALAYRKEYETWKDSLNDQNKVWAIADLEKKFAVKEKQKEVNILEAENKLKAAERNGFIISSVLLLLLLGGGIYLYKQKNKTSKIILEQKNELDILNAAKDKMFSIVSHDLRSSVNALKRSNTKLLENLESKNFAALDALLHQNSAITNETYNLLENLLNWALVQTKQVYFHQESLHLHSIVEQVQYNYTALAANKNISLENSVSIDEYVYADLDSLKIIIRNLIDNAIKFTNPNGFISIYSRHSDNENCCLVIEDSGIGMNALIRNSILNPAAIVSKKDKDEFVGTALGLQLCKSLIIKNEGQLEIESEENKGTKMIIILPQAK